MAEGKLKEENRSESSLIKGKNGSGNSLVKKNLDYKKTGLKSGIEIHQQLDTGKLFCNCPGYLRSDKPDFVVKRKLHAVPGELGEVDIAVEFEAVKGKTFEYQGYDDTTCLVELDEEPPHTINENALDEAIKIALLLNCEIYPVAQIMRKTVIDGSDTSGFQRTFLIAHDGFVETSFGKVRIDSIALEEDAARIINNEENKVVFRLDRLGIPLVEIMTSPDMKTPEQIKETALKLGEILRATKVKRGIGTIRQDVNISIKGHDRVEIKGFQEPKIMIKTVELEVERQKQELKKKKREGGVRKVLPDGKTEFLRPMPGGARMYPETDLPLLKISRDKINSLKKKLPKLRTEIMKGLKKKGLSDELINLIVAEHDYLDSFNVLMKVYDKNPELVAKMITIWRQEFATKYNKKLGEVFKILHERVLESILEKVDERVIDERDVRDVMIKIMEGKNFKDAIKIKKISKDELEEKIRKIINKKPGLSAKAYMGLVMKEFKGKIDAEKAVEIIKRALEE